MENNELAIPKGLSKHGKRAAQVILNVLKKNKETHTGGCKALYTPGEWRKRGEEYGLKSELVVVHDGGDVASYFNYDYEEYGRCDEMTNALGSKGLFAEPCTSWYTAVYCL